MAVTLGSTGITFPDATTQTTAASAGGTVTAVASGALTSGAQVILNSDGTVSVAAATASTVSQVSGNLTAYAEGTRQGYYTVIGTWDSVNNAVCVWWVDGVSYVRGAVGLVSGSTITFNGVRYTVATDSSMYYAWGIAAIYIPSIGRHLIACTGDNGNTYLKTMSVSSTGTMSASSNDVCFGGDFFQGPDLAYDTGASRAVLVAFSSPAGNVIRAIAVNVTSSSTSAGTAITIATVTSNDQRPAIEYDSVTTKSMVIYAGSSSYPTAKVLTVSGSTVSGGAAAVIESVASRNYLFGIGYSTTAQKFFMAWSNTTSSFVRGVVASISGTSVSAGTIADTATGYNNLPYTGFYYTTTNTLYMSASYFVIPITISGTTFTAGTVGNTNAGNTEISFIDGGNSLYFYQLSRNGNFHPAVISYKAYTTPITSTNLLGISSASYTNGQTATIQVVGTTNSSQSGLTAGLKYYVNDAGALVTSPTTLPYAGLAMSATKILIKG